jgi:alanyl-tRNA synthetase
LALTSVEIRNSFLNFFEQRGHKKMAGTSLIPADPTTLFTSAGVQQFVPAFRGDVPVAYPRATTCQKCLRADDINEVGDRTHETFFEMLGNFSIGDYFKKEAIEWAWEYSIKELGLTAERIWVTVHTADEQAYSVWRQIGIPEARIVRLASNWWPATENWVGSTGACSELHMDLGEAFGCGKPDCGPECSCGRFVEYWNCVFPEFFQNGPGRRSNLERPGVDTGLGFERLVAVLQGKTSIFECDLFAPIVEAIHNRAHEINHKYEPGTDDKSVRATRIVADHSRAVTFALSEGIMPSNEGRGYVVRKLLRRASYFGWKLAGALGAADANEVGFEQFLVPVAQRVIAEMADIYPELRANQEFILNNIGAEEERFESAILSGFPNLTRAVAEAQGTLSGETVFRFYDTYGIPVDLTREIAAESSIEVDEAGFEQAMQEQRTRSRAASADKFAIQRTGVYQEFIGVTKFVGYEKDEDEARIIGIVQDGESKQSISAGEAEIVLDKTPFYTEQGGQIGDQGWLETATGKAVVSDTVFAIEKVVVHRARIEQGALKVGDTVHAVVDAARRKAIARAHTGTHLLHYVLRKTLGPHALQSGSLVEPDWFRFDFAHFEKVPAETLAAIAAEVNRLILENHPVSAQILDLASARELGAMALFGEKYGEEVRMMRIGDFSKELCGGTHLHTSAEVGLFIIASEGSVGAGLRRIEALCGARAVEKIQHDAQALAGIAAELNAPADEIVARIAGLQAELKQAQRQIAQLQQKQAGGLAQDLLAQAQAVGETKVIAAHTPEMPPEALRNLADSLVEKLGSGVAVLVTEGEKSWPMVAKVSEDLLKKGVHAGKLIGEVAKRAGGGGGGRPDFAQAAAKDPSRVAEALGAVPEIVIGQMKG